MQPQNIITRVFQSGMRSRSRWTTLPPVRKLAVLLVVCGSIGLAASWLLTVDNMQLLANPHFRPSCDINPVLSCGSVMQTREASVFGFANSLLGLPAYAVVVCIGAAIMAGGNFKRWFWLSLQAGALAGVALTQWLFYESVFRINALCPFCMVVWVVTMAIFWYTLLYNLRCGNIRWHGRKPARRVTNYAVRHHLDIYLAWMVIMAGVVLAHFWYYFGPHL